tara:strand:+ start:1010 stop:1771 length:762 start_codon:yes stop_codon:yes gene_type:complete
MNYKFFFILFFIFINSCANQNISSKKISDPIIVQTYSNSGFTLVYSDELFKNKIVNKKLNNRDLFVFQKNLKKDTTVKITNILNNKSVIATVKNKSKYPNFYNSVITSRIASEIELDIDEPYILIESIDQNSVFYAGKAKTFEEEKNVANKAPVEGVNIINISASAESNKKDTKITKNFNYIIKIANFYYEETAKLVKERIMLETNIKNINIDKISKNNFRLSIGPYKLIKNLKKDFDKIETLYFENLELIKL